LVTPLKKLRKKSIMICLSENEIEVLMDYTGMEEAMYYEMIKTPVVFFSRSQNVINHVTIIKDLMKGN